MLDKGKYMFFTHSSAINSYYTVLPQTVLMLRKECIETTSTTATGTVI